LCFTEEMNALTVAGVIFRVLHYAGDLQFLIAVREFPDHVREIQETYLDNYDPPKALRDVDYGPYD